MVRGTRLGSTLAPIQQRVQPTAEGPVSAQRSEQILLDLVKELARTAAAPWWGVVQHSLSALSDVLTATTTQRSARILRAQESFEHGVLGMKPHFALQPLFSLSSMTPGLSERARQSVGSHGDNT